MESRTGNVSLNATYTAGPANNLTAGTAISQIGHGGHIRYYSTGAAGDEATFGLIQGDVTVIAGGAKDDPTAATGILTLGATVAADTSKAGFHLLSRVGHGGRAELGYGTGNVTGDGELEAVHLGIHSFEDLTSTPAAAHSYSTDILTRAAEVNIVAKSTVQNSASFSQLALDNLQHSQIGHGYFNVGSLSLNGPVVGAINDATVFSTLSGNPYSGQALSAIKADLDADGKLGDFDTDPAVTNAEAQLTSAKNFVDNAATKADVFPAGAHPYAGLTAEQIANKMDPDHADYDDPNAVGGIYNPKQVWANELATFVGNQAPNAQNNAARTGTSASALNIIIKEGDIAGDITVKDELANSKGITLSSTMAAGLSAITNDVMQSRIGHGSLNVLDSPNGGTHAGTGAGLDGGNINIDQAHILGADIVVATPGTSEADDDIKLETSISAGLSAVKDNTAVAQIGHSGDVFAKTGNGGASSTDPSQLSGDGGDITINKGTVWDGTEEASSRVDYGGSTDVYVLSNNQIIVDSDTAASLASADRNNAESSIGHGQKLRLLTGDGRSTPAGASGGRGGDILITQRTVTRDVDGGDENDTARGLRGNIVLAASETDSGYAIHVTADDTAALAATNNNSNISRIGHGDVIETITGKGGNGGTAGANTAGASPATQPESFGGRGGHIDIQLEDMLIEGDILSADIAANVAGINEVNGVFGAINLYGTVTNALAPSNRAFIRSNIGHGQLISAHAGDGGNGGSALYLANAHSVSETETELNKFLVGFGEETDSANADMDKRYAAGGGASRGGNGGDVRIITGKITDRVNSGGTISHDGEADIMLNIQGNNTTPTSVNIVSDVVHALSEGNGSDLFSGIGHHTRLYGEGGIGGNGGQTNTEFDGNGNLPVGSNPEIQPDASGGRGGDVLLTTGDIIGDVVVDAPRYVRVESIAGDGRNTKVMTAIGHSTDVVAAAQKGGDGANLYGSGTVGATNDGGIEDQNSGKTITLVDGNDDDTFDLTGVDDNNDTSNEDGIDTNGDGVGETFATLEAQYGNNLNGAAVNAAINEIIFHDGEGDPQYLIDDQGNADPADDVYVFNDPANNALDPLRNAGVNTERFGRVVGGYEADLGVGNNTPRYVDLNRDGAVDLVDFDADGRIDIVDVDKNGVYDRIDGRASFGDNTSGWGILDYVAVTGKQPDVAGHKEGGWTLSNQLAKGDQGISASETLVGDFSTSNGGRGGDAKTQVGYILGDVAVDTGDPTSGEDSLLVKSHVQDDIVATGGKYDISVARIGHGGYQFSDTDGTYSDYASGRVETGRLNGQSVNEGQGHDAADGGNAGEFAMNASGGRGGDATLIQGVARDLDGNAGMASETDHLVGNIYINVPDFVADGSASDHEKPQDLTLGSAHSAGSKRVTVSASTNNDAGENLSVAMIGHGSEAWATANNTGGAGASFGGVAPTSSQTEIANGGRGGDVDLTQNQIKGLITVMAGADDATTDGDYSVQILAEKGPAITAAGSYNTIVSQIGHGRVAGASGGDGGAGDDGQQRADGGRGGDVDLTQAAILDARILIDTHEENAGGNSDADYYGNGMLIDSSVKLGSGQIVRAQAGSGDLAFINEARGARGYSSGGKGGAATTDSAVIEQLNQTANGGRGGDATLNQAGYSNDIVLDLGANEVSATTIAGGALTIKTHVDTIFTGTNNHVLGTVGHGGYGHVLVNSGGAGGLRDGTYAITSGDDPNQRTDIDNAMRITLGTDRNGGRGGIAVSNIGTNGTGRALTGRDGYSYGLNDSDGADISITLHDKIDGVAAGENDGVLIESKSGQGDNQTRSIDVTSSLIGHHGFNRADASAASGGNALQFVLAATISEGNGGDGGDSTATTGFVDGDVTISNVVSGELNNTKGADDVDIVIRSFENIATDDAKHRAEARVGHLASAEALAGKGGLSAKPGAGPTVYPATISAQGGDGGDATVGTGQLSGHITLTAENSINVLADSATVGSATNVAATGHRVESEAVAGVGGQGGLSAIGSQNLYFIYEALLEYEKNGQNLNALSDFERKLVSAFFNGNVSGGENHSGYFEDKVATAFFERIIEGQRDNDATAGSSTEHRIAALSTEEEEVLMRVMAAAGDGGHAKITQGGAIGGSANLATNGNILLTALSHNVTDTDRGIVFAASDSAATGGMAMVHAGHQAEVISAKAGDAAGVRAYSNGIGGDGGDATVTQEAFAGDITLDSRHELAIETLDNAVSNADLYAYVGHRQAIGADRESYRSDPVVEAGEGGSELSNLSLGFNGNGGDVTVNQRGGTGAITLQAYETDNTSDNFVGAHDDGTQIRIRANDVANGSGEHETQVGHDILLASAKAGDAGRRHSNHSAVSNDGGVLSNLVGILEGNGGDIIATQGALDGDIAITGRDDVAITSLTTLGGDNRVLIGHEQGAGMDFAHTAASADEEAGKLVAGYGGDSVPDEIDADANGHSGTKGDGDGGNVILTQEGIGKSDITITSRTGDVDVLATVATGGDSDTEIGHQRHAYAESGAAGQQQGSSGKNTAADGGDIDVTRGAIAGDILIQALGQDATAGTPKVNREVIVQAKTGPSGYAETLIGHEEDMIFYTDQNVVTAGDYGGFGGEYTIDYDDLLNTFASNNAAYNTAGAVTIRDANNARSWMESVRNAVRQANRNADRLHTADQLKLHTALTRLGTALADYDTARASYDAAGDNVARATAMDAMRQSAADAKTAYDLAVDAFDLGSADHNQITDHADAGDITYHGTGTVSGDITLQSANAFSGANQYQNGVVAVLAEAATGTRAESELGHRRTMYNDTGIGGGRNTPGGTPSGGVAGDGGSITATNKTDGDVTINAHEVVINSKGTASSEVHLGHDLEIQNRAGRSDVADEIGNGGDITVVQHVGQDDGGTMGIESANVVINTNYLASALAVGSNQGSTKDGELRSESGNSAVHLGQQVDLHSNSDSDITTGGTGSSYQNRGGMVTSTQLVDGDIQLSLDADNDGIFHDAIIKSQDTVGATQTRLGHLAHQTATSGRDATHAGLLVDALTAGTTADPAKAKTDISEDDGDDVTANQVVEGDIAIFKVEDLQIAAASSAPNRTYVGHSGVNIALSGSIDDATGPEDGGVVDADQTIRGLLALGTGGSELRSLSIETLANNAGEVHVGHEGEQRAQSADDNSAAAASPSGPVALNMLDVDADQTIDAKIELHAGQIKLSSNNGQVQVGHEGKHFTATDVGGASDVDSQILNDIIVRATGVDSGSNDANTMLQPSVHGDLIIENIVASGGAQLGHEHESSVGHGAGNVARGQVDSLQVIGSHTDANADGEVDDTSVHVISIATARDLVVDSQVAGDTRIGHHISETADALHYTKNAAAGSVMRQVVGSDIVIGTPAAGMAGTEKVGNSLIVKSAGGGTAQIGHESPGSNEWQDGVTAQLLDGDITIDVGADADAPAANGTAVATLGAGDDDVILDGSGGGTVLVGHNHADFAETAANEHQVSAGNIWVEAGADFHVLTGQVGHKHYDFDGSANIKSTNVSGAGTVRNRIRGNTTLGAAQNTAAQDANVTPKVMLLNTADINSGYGGKASKDVDGQLRFFMSSQENLTIEAPVRFNDSVSGADAVTVRDASPANVFTGTGGTTDHEHLFETMSGLAAYEDDKIGDGNYGFYFGEVEAPATTTNNEIEVPVQRFFSINYQSIRVIHRNGPRSVGTINLGGLDDDMVVGTGSFDLLCENGAQDCGSSVRFFPAVGGSTSSSGGFGSASGSLGLSLPSIEDEDERKKRGEAGQGQGTSPSAGTNPASGQQASANSVIARQQPVVLAQTLAKPERLQPQSEDIVVASTPSSSGVSHTFTNQLRSAPAPLQARAGQALQIETQSQATGASLTLEAGYGQMLATGVNSQQILRQIGYANALSSASSYDLFATNGS
ncbi:MAG: hypothetical protein N4A65_11840 [Cohaesibacter sp.]|nr:hypothetical protein [Cohaesibacter sp.]